MTVQAFIDGGRAARDQADSDAARARELVDLAMERHSKLRRLHAPQDILAAAQVYATLATRRY